MRGLAKPSGAEMPGRVWVNADVENGAGVLASCRQTIAGSRERCEVRFRRKQGSRKVGNTPKTWQKILEIPVTLKIPLPL